MKKPKKFVLGLAIAGLASSVLAACSDADTVSHNLSKDADNFKVWRQIVLYNAITDKYILEVDGYCSLGNNDANDRVSVTCKVNSDNDTDSYIKDIYLKSDNTMVFEHQVAGVHESPDHYKIVLKPESVVPGVEVR